MSVANRIKSMRKELGYSQKLLGEKLGTSRDVINNLENGRVEPTELIIKSICNQFGISYDWLKNGKGDMRDDQSQDSVAAIIDELMAGENETAKAVFRAFARFDDRDWQTIQKIMDEMQKK